METVYVYTTIIPEHFVFFRQRNYLATMFRKKIKGIFHGKISESTTYHTFLYLESPHLIVNSSTLDLFKSSKSTMSYNVRDRNYDFKFFTGIFFEIQR